ncbi:MAG: protein-export chaperone SecB [Bacteroidota bacterium]
MRIQLESWKIQTLSFNIIEDTREENSFALKIGQVFPEKEKKQFVIIFDIDLKGKYFDLVFQVAFIFSTEEEIEEEFKFSDFPKINAPAIAFPFIRSYISNFTLQSGFEPVILPSINFVKLAEEK